MFSKIRALAQVEHLFVLEFSAFIHKNISFSYDRSIRPYVSYDALDNPSMILSVLKVISAAH